MQVYLSIQEELLKLLLELDKFSIPGGQADIICEKMISAEVNDDNIHWWKGMRMMTIGNNNNSK